MSGIVGFHRAQDAAKALVITTLALGTVAPEGSFTSIEIPATPPAACPKQDTAMSANAAMSTIYLNTKRALPKYLLPQSTKSVCRSHEKKWAEGPIRSPSRASGRLPCHSCTLIVVWRTISGVRENLQYCSWRTAAAGAQGIYFKKAKTCAPNEYRELEETFSPAALQILGDRVVRHTSRLE